MSTNRENVIWQSADGTWNRGFYDFYETGDWSDPDYDHEWDVEYTQDFSWVSTGHPSMEAAERSWRGSNPGGWSEYPYDPARPDANEIFDDKAAQCYDAATRDPAYRQGLHCHPYYEGPGKGRKTKFLMADLVQAKLEAARYKLDGYANSPSPRMPLWQARVDAIVAKGNPASIELVNRVNADYADGLQKMLDERRRRDAERTRWSAGRPDWEALRRKEAAQAEVEAEIERARKPLTVPQVTKPANPPTPAASGATKPAGASYHISPETGRPNKCYATKKPCPYGGASDHYPDKATARAAYEKKMGGSF